MLHSRRFLLGTVGLALAAPRLARADDAAMSERSIGKADAKTVVQEYFSLTCTHCAHFAKETFPEVKAKLIDTGKVRYVFRDFPLDQVALTAAMVARSLPPDRYEPFVLALLASQDRWAFARGVNSIDELWKMASLAGLSRTAFDAAISNTALRSAILSEQDEGQKRWKVDSTPTFIINGKKETGAMDYAAFEKLVSTDA